MNLDYLLMRLQPTNEGKSLYFEAIQQVIHPSSTSRLNSFIELIHLCASKSDKTIIEFTQNLISADYLFTVDPKLAAPFFDQALKTYAKITQKDPLDINENDIIHIYNTKNLKGRWDSQRYALRNIYLLIGISRRLRIDLALEELPPIGIPSFQKEKDVLSSVIICFLSVMIIMNSLDTYQQARMIGHPIPLSQALEWLDVLGIFIGISMLIFNLLSILYQYAPQANRFISRLYLWRYRKYPY